MFYGLVKLHKEGKPIRPIVSMCGSPTYQLSKFLSNIITPLTDSANQKLRNSVQAKNELEALIIPENQVLSSFDVKQMYTSIPQQLAVEVLKTALDNDSSWKQRTCLDAQDIIDLVELCCDCNVFQFRNKIYKQIQGTPMGSSISVCLAELTMQHIEKIAFESPPCQPIIWKRYVDDAIAVLPEDKVQIFLNYLNSINANIQFTVELEQNKKLSYLDLEITRQSNGTLLFSTYQKATHTDRYLDYSSNHPSCQKRSLVKTLVQRAEKLSSTSVVEREVEKVKNTLQKNGYPSAFINSATENSNSTSQNQQDRVKYVGAPYIKGSSERVARILKPYNIQLAHKPTNTLRSKLCNVKDKVDKENISGCVYKIGCNDCDNVYIGETRKNLRDRVKEHSDYVRKQEGHSQVYQHVRQTRHSIGWQNVSVLTRNNNNHQRKFLEACYTISNSKAYNRSQGISDHYKHFVVPLLQHEHN